MIKYLSFAILLIILSISLSGQDQFFSAFSLEGVRQQGGRAIVQLEDDTYVGVNQCYNTDWIGYNICFTHFSQSGRLLRVDTLLTPEWTSFDFHNELDAYDNKAYTIARNGFNENLYLEYDPYIGAIDTVFTFLPSNIEEGSLCNDFKHLSKDYLALILIREEKAIIATLENGNVYTEYQLLPSTGHRFTPTNIVHNLEAGFTVGGLLQNFDDSNDIPYFFELDDNFNVINEYSFGIGYEDYFLRTFIQDAHGDYVCSFGYDVDFITNAGTEAHIVKFNFEDGIIWTSHLGPSARTYLNSYRSILESPNSDGYLLGGYLSSDTIFNLQASIAKLSMEGDSIWEKRYVYTNNWNDVLQIGDMEYTNDGDLICYGRHRYGTTDIVPEGENIWKIFLMKVDVDGNILDTISDVIEYNSDKVTLYPVPTSKSLTIDNLEDQHYLFEIFNLNGSLLSSTKKMVSNQKVVLEDIPNEAGIYLLKIIDRKENTYSFKKFIVE